MTFAAFRPIVLSLLALTMGMAQPATAQAGWLWDWLFHRDEQPVAYGAMYAPNIGYYSPGVSAYRPVVAYYPPATPSGCSTCDAGNACSTCNTCGPQCAVPAYGIPQAQLIQPGSVSYRWVTNYRSRGVVLPVTAYRPVVAFNATGIPIPTYQGCTTETHTTQRVPYQEYVPTYRPAIYGTPYQPAPTYAVPSYGVPMVNPGCASCNAGNVSYMPVTPTPAASYPTTYGQPMSGSTVVSGPAPAGATSDPSGTSYPSGPPVVGPNGDGGANVAPVLPAGGLQPLPPQTKAAPLTPLGGHATVESPATTQSATFPVPHVPATSQPQAMPRLRLVPDVELEEPKNNDAERAPRLLNPDDRTATMPMRGRYESVPISWHAPVAESAAESAPTVTPVAPREIELQPAANEINRDETPVRPALLNVPAEIAPQTPLPAPQRKLIEWESTGWQTER